MAFFIYIIIAYNNLYITQLKHFEAFYVCDFETSVNQFSWDTAAPHYSLDSIVK